jgi:hypothetical protein
MSDDGDSTKRVTAAFGRQMAAFKQMREHSGPIYETARERSRIASAAWRAAGSPKPVHLVHIAGVRRYVIWGRARDPASWTLATDAQVAAWYAWWRERERLRREAVRAS